MIALDKFVKEGKKFDFVFGDLTDIPISETPTGEIWNFIRTILQQSFKILKPNGKYLTHVMKSICRLIFKYIDAKNFFFFFFITG